jgi:hypothetical protein
LAWLKKLGLLLSPSRRRQDVRLSRLKAVASAHRREVEEWERGRKNAVELYKQAAASLRELGVRPSEFKRLALFASQFKGAGAREVDLRALQEGLLALRPALSGRSKEVLGLIGAYSDGLRVARDCARYRNAAGEKLLRVNQELESVERGLGLRSGKRGVVGQ